MEISGLISALVIGAVVGVLGRLVVPGRQHIGVLWTVVVGVGAALLGTALARAVGLSDTSGPDWVEWLAQVLCAALGVAALSRVRALERSRPPRKGLLELFDGGRPGNTEEGSGADAPRSAGRRRN